MSSGLLHEYFERRWRQWPDRPAIDIPPGHGRPARVQVTYAELEGRSAALAAHLRPRLGHESLIALLLPRTSAEAYIAELAILRAGAAFVAIDPVSPDERVARLLADAQARAIVTDPAGAERSCRLGMAESDVIIAGAPAAARHDNDRSQPGASETLAAGSLAYVIYTSGTTGAPKGVMVEHGAIANLVASDIGEFHLSPTDRVGHTSSHAYDSSIEEIWLAWSAGAVVVVVDDDVARSGPDLVSWIEAERLTVLCPPPTLLRAMGGRAAASRLRQLRLVYAGGEPLPSDVAEAWAEGRRLVNGYGPTECAVTAIRGDVNFGDPVTIGRPVAGVRAFVLNEALEEVAPGTRGELCLAGAGLARGYLHAPELTALKFPVHPQLGRIYRTGDLAHCREDGAFVTHGRLDSQVKLRGYRLELEEIEAHLARCPGIRSAACRVETDGMRQDLVAFVVSVDPESLPAIDDLRTALARTLPAHAVPHQVRFLTSLPLTAGGKLDRAALPAASTGPDRPVGVTIAPRDQIEGAIADSLRTWFAADRPLSIDQHFFTDLGGDSLRAAQLVTALRERAETALITVRDVYEAPTIRRLANRVRAAGSARPADPDRAFGQTRATSAAPIVRPLAATILQAGWIMAEAAAGGALLYGSVFGVLPAVVSALGVVPTVLLSPLIAALALTMYVVLALAFAVVVKRVLIGRYAPVRAPVWSGFYVRHWMVHQAVRALPWSLVSGTEFELVALRALGARIGRRVHIHRGVDLRQGGWDLLEIGDDVTVSQDAALRLVDLDAGQIVVGPIVLGCDVTVDVRAGVAAHTRIDRGGYLAAHAHLAAQACIPEGERWSGIPAGPAGLAPVAPVVSSDRGRLTPWQYGVARCLASLSVAIVLALPVEALVILAASVQGAQVQRLLMWLVALLAMPLTVAWTALIVRVLGRVAPGVIDRWSWAYVRVWIKTGLLQASGDWLSGTLFWPPWLRASGMAVGRGCEISTIIDVVPELVEIGEFSFLADGVYLGGPSVHRGTVRLEHTRLDAEVFVGNHAVIPAGQRVAPNVLVGVSTIAGEGATRAGTSWFGHPPFELARRAQQRWDRRVTLDPTPLRYANRLCWETLRGVIPVVGLAGGVWWLSGVEIASARLSGGALWGSAVGLSFAAGALLCAFVLALKWLLLGRVAPGEHPLWSCWCSRWDFLYVAWAHLARPVLARFEGTLLLSWYLRAMGARIGARVVFGGGSAQMVDPDMIEIEDGATVHALFQAHTFEDRVLKIDRIRIRRGATVGHGAVLLYGSEVGAGAAVSANSVVMKHERLTPGRAYAGCPVQEI